MASTASDIVDPPSRFGAALIDLGSLLALVWAVPVAILLVGAPIAGAIALVLWVVRLVSGGS